MGKRELLATLQVSDGQGQWTWAYSDVTGIVTQNQQKGVTFSTWM